MPKVVVKKHFVTFYSPGTLFPETTEKSISSWNVKKAMKMADDITERYGATPYAFRFSTYGRTAKDLDSKNLKSSPLYFLGGKVLTAEQVLAGTDPKEEILRSNVRINNIKRIIVNDNSWRFTGELGDKDVVLEYKPKKKK